MANIEKFNKEFKPKVVLTAEEMNEVVEKINELVDGVNEGGGGGGTTIEIDSSLSETSKNPVENQVITKELNKKINNSSVYTKQEIDKKFNEISLEASTPYTRSKMKKIHIKIDGLKEGTYTVKPCPLKYNTNNVISFTTDDSNTSTLSVIWAAINKRPISIHSIDNGSNGKTYQYHANQYLAGDIPSDIIIKTFNDYITYSDLFGNRHRFKQGVAIWPYVGNKDGAFMDRVANVDKTATNLYRFRLPYLLWDDCNLLKHYGVDFYYHNIGVEEFGSDKDIYNVIQGLNADLIKTKNNIGRTMKIIARPDGNNVFMDAMLEMPKIDMSVSENSPAVDCMPYNQEDWFHKVWIRRFFDDIEGELKNTLTTLMNETDLAAKKWFHFCCHTATSTWADFLKYISDTYGSANNKIWFTTVGELYEYKYISKYGRILNLKATGTTVEFDYEFSYKENFNYKEMTFLLEKDNLGSQNTSLENVTIDAYDSYTNEKINGMQLALDENKVLAHINIEESLIESIEYFISKYEETEDIIWKEDAELELTKIREDLRSVYQARIDAVVSPVEITSIESNKLGLTLNNSNIDTVVITANPSTNTQMSKIKARISSGNIELNIDKSVEGNKATFSINNTSKVNGNYTGNLQFYVEGKEEIETTIPVNVTVDEVPSDIPISTVTIEAPTSAKVNTTAHVKVTALPSDNTQMSTLDVNTEEGGVTISNKVKNKNVFEFDMTYTESGNKTIKIVESTSSKEWTKDITIEKASGGEDDKLICLATYSYPDIGSINYIQDSVYGGIVNLENLGKIIYIPDSTPIYSKSGKIVEGFFRKTDTNQAVVEALGYTYANFAGASNMNGDLSSMFEHQTWYKYLYKYNAEVSNAVMYSVPAGNYQIRFLSCSSENRYYNQAIYLLNGVDITSQMPTKSLINNTDWTDWFNVTVGSEGLITFVIKTIKSGNIGFNAIEIKIL